MTDKSKYHYSNYHYGSILPILERGNFDNTEFVNGYGLRRSKDSASASSSNNNSSSDQKTGKLNLLIVSQSRYYIHIVLIVFSEKRSMYHLVVLNRIQTGTNRISPSLKQIKDFLVSLSEGTPLPIIDKNANEDNTLVSNGIFGILVANCPSPIIISQLFTYRNIRGHFLLLGDVEGYCYIWNFDTKLYEWNFHTTFSLLPEKDTVDVSISSGKHIAALEYCKDSSTLLWIERKGSYHLIDKDIKACNSMNNDVNGQLISNDNNDHNEVETICQDNDTTTNNPDTNNPGMPYPGIAHLDVDNRTSLFSDNLIDSSKKREKLKSIKLLEDKSIKQHNENENNDRVRTCCMYLKSDNNDDIRDTNNNDINHIFKDFDNNIRLIGPTTILSNVSINSIFTANNDQKIYNNDNENERSKKGNQDDESLYDRSSTLTSESRIRSTDNQRQYMNLENLHSGKYAIHEKRNGFWIVSKHVEGRVLNVYYYDIHECRLLSIDISLNMEPSTACNSNNNNGNNNDKIDSREISMDHNDSSDDIKNKNSNEQIISTTDKPTNLNTMIYKRLKKGKQNCLFILYGNYVYIITENRKLEVLKIDHHPERSLRKPHEMGMYKLSEHMCLYIYVCLYRYDYVCICVYICIFLRIFENGNSLLSPYAIKVFICVYV